MFYFFCHEVGIADTGPTFDLNEKYCGTTWI